MANLEGDKDNHTDNAEVGNPIVDDDGENDIISKVAKSFADVFRQPVSEEHLEFLRRSEIEGTPENASKKENIRLAQAMQEHQRRAFEVANRYELEDDSLEE